MKQGKLYTVTKGNLFAFGDPIKRADVLASKLYGENYGDKGFTLQDYMNDEGKNWFGISKKNNPFSKMNIGNTAKVAEGAVAAVGSQIGVSDRNKRGMYDVLDPVHQLAGGRESGVGNALGDAGVGLFQAGVSSNNPGLMLAGAAGKVIGGAINILAGIKTDKKAKKLADNDIAALSNMESNASSFDDVGTANLTTNASGVYKGGWFSGGRARRKNAALQADLDNSLALARNNINNNIQNIASDQMSNMMRNYAADGGLLDIMPSSINDMPATNLGLAYDYLAVKRKQAENKNKLNGMQQVVADNVFALGGDYQTNGADWTNGMTHIDAGRSHEENPNQGVQMGVDPEGTPNLVEEGEVIFNDYVYSKRIKLDSKAKERMHFPKKRDITYAEAAKSLEKESKERPNDPISQAALKAQMEDLAEEQERQKQEMEAARAREAFEALSPEEQTAIMQQVAQQEQRAQEQAIQEQAMAEQAAAEQQPTPEEIAMAEQQQQMVQGVPTADAMGTVATAQPIMACGGRINKFDEGGMKQKIYNLLKLKTKSDWDAWVKKNGLDGLNDFEDWDNALQNTELINAIAKDNPALADALEKGYDFGQYKAPSSKYDLEAFRKVLSEYTKSKKQGNTQGMYAIDKDFGLGNYKTIKELEESPEYKAYTQYLTDMLNRAKGVQWRRKDKSKTGVYDNVEFKDGKTLSKEDYDTLFTLAKTAEGTRTKDKGDYVPIFDYDADKDGWYGLRDDALQTVLRLRGDQKGGIFHLNPTAIKRGTQANNYVINEDGTVEALEGGLDGLKLDSSYQWADPQTDYTNNYYRRAAAANANGQNGTAGNNGNNNPAAGTGDDREVVPIHRNDKLRYVGLFGPAVGLSMQLAGIGRPDTSGLDAAVNMSRGAGHLADYQPIGDYMRYQPLDRLFYANQLQANARATDRNLMNTSGGNRGAAMAGLLANNYNTNNNLGNLWRQAEEYNLAQRERVATFNKDTNKFNADAYNTTSRFNADALNRQGQYSAQLAMQAAREKIDADAAWNQGIYGNVAGLFKGIGDLGRENAQHNMIADMAATGIFGTIKNQPIGNGYIRVVPRNEAAKGGKINKKKGKRGLTY